jgi:hypothetical protein
MGPRDEAPGAASDWGLIKVLRCRRRHHGGHRHGKELGEDVERLGQREDDGRIVGHRNAGNVPRLPGRELARAFDRKERPLPAAARRGVERAPHRGPHVARADRSPVVERRIGSKMKGVDGAGPVALPPGRDPRLQLPIGVELDQVVEQQGHDFAALDVVRERGIERRRVGAFVVREPATGRPLADRTAGGQEHEAGQMAAQRQWNWKARRQAHVDMKA